MMSHALQSVLFFMGLGRIAIGLAPFVAAKASARMIGFPEAHDSPTARLMGRFFGVRDMGLGVLAFYATRHPEALTFVLLFNAAMDLGDLVSCLIPIIKRQGISRGAITSSLFAATGGAAWLVVWAVTRGQV